MYLYISLFVGLLIAGEVVLIPAIYVSLRGGLPAEGVIFTALAATLISDSFWYGVGRLIPYRQIISLPLLERKKERLQRLSDRFSRLSITLFLLSKFLYGTRIIMQVLYGLHKFPLIKYAAVNFFSICLWIGILYGIGSLTKLISEILKIPSLSEETVFTILFIVIITPLLWTIHRVSKRLLQS